MAITAAHPPEAGQLVSVRSRQWVVADVTPSALPADRLRAGLESQQHLQRLSSVEDDGLGTVALPYPMGYASPIHLYGVMVCSFTCIGGVIGARLAGYDPRAKRW